MNMGIKFKYLIDKGCISLATQRNSIGFVSLVKKNHVVFLNKLH